MIESIHQDARTNALEQAVLAAADEESLEALDGGEVSGALVNGTYAQHPVPSLILGKSYTNAGVTMLHVVDPKSLLDRAMFDRRDYINIGEWVKATDVRPSRPAAAAVRTLIYALDKVGAHHTVGRERREKLEKLQDIYQDWEDRHVSSPAAAMNGSTVEV